MKHFYRFYRPTCFNIERSEIETLSEGGICFWVSRDGTISPSTLQVRFSVCHPNQAFNRDIARKLARNNSNTWIIDPPSCSTEDIVNAMRFGKPVEVVHYMTGIEPELEVNDVLQELYLAIDRISYLQSSSLKHAKAHKDIIEALHLEERYHELQKR